MKPFQSNIMFRVPQRHSVMVLLRVIESVFAATCFAYVYVRAKDT